MEHVIRPGPGPYQTSKHPSRQRQEQMKVLFADGHSNTLIIFIDSDLIFGCKSGLGYNHTVACLPFSLWCSTETIIFLLSFAVNALHCEYVPA